METKVNYVYVGVFVLLLSAALIAGILWLSAGSQYNKAYDIYVTYMHESVSGLNLNAPVKFRGVNVGTVQQIALDKSDPEKVRLELNIEKGTPVTEDTIATLKSQGLTGIAYVELNGGSRESPLMKPANKPPYPEISSGLSLMGRLDVGMSGMLVSFNKTTDSLTAFLDNDNRRAFKKTLANIAALSTTLASHKNDIDKVMTNTSTTMENMAKISEQLPALIEHIDHSAQALEKMADNTSNASDSVRKTFDGVGPDAKHFAEEGLPELEKLIVELRELSTSLLHVSQQVEQQPSILLRGKEARQRGPGE